MANVKDLLVNGSARVVGTIYGNTTSANKVNNKLTVGSKTFDGSKDVTINASDLGLASAMLFLGTTTTAITDGAKTNPVVISGSNKTATAGNVVLYGSKEFVWTGSAWEELGNEGSYKIVQSAVGDPSASGTSNTFIDTISQDANGKITATKKTVAVTNSAPTLSWGTTSTIGSVAGTNLQVKMPANPNTWRGIQNNLTSDSTTDSLSAAQGKALKALIDGKAASSHTHDDRYYTESEIDTKVNTLNTAINNISTVYYGDGVDSAITPLNADQLQGHPASYFATSEELNNIITNGTPKLDTARTISLSNDASGSTNFDGSANVTISTTNLRLSQNTSTLFSDPGGLTWLNLDGPAGAAVDVNDTPTSEWWYILRNRHTNTRNNFYTDLAIPFNDNSIYYKIVRNNVVANGGWIKVLDTLNYTGTLDSHYVLKSGDTMTGNLTAPSIYTSNWFRSTGATGWYNETYGGGLYMSDSTYIRNYAGKTTRLDNLCLGADNNSYRLYVNGNTLLHMDNAYGAYTELSPTLRVNGKLNIYDNVMNGGTANSLLNILYNGTHEFGLVMKLHSYGGDSPAIRFSHSSDINDLNKQVNTNWSVGMYYDTTDKFAITQDRGTSGWGAARLIMDPGGITNFYITNQWLNNSVIQIGRKDNTAFTDRAVIGVTDGNLHLDPYSNHDTYLNYYNHSRTYFSGSTYYINEDGSYYNGSAANAGNADTLDGYHESSFLRYRDVVGGSGGTSHSDSLWSQIGIRQYNNALPDAIADNDTYTWGSVVSLPGIDSRLDIWYNHFTSSSNRDGLRYRTGWDNDKKAWATILDSLNYASYAVGYPNLNIVYDSFGFDDTFDYYASHDGWLYVHIGWGNEHRNSVIHYNGLTLNDRNGDGNSYYWFPVKSGDHIWNNHSDYGLYGGQLTLYGMR